MPSKVSLLEHPKYAKVMQLYNEELIKNGKVSGRKFYRDVIAVEIPELPHRTWAYFLQKRVTPTGLPAPIDPTLPPINAIQTTLLSNQQATEEGLQAALNIGRTALRDLLNDPIALARMPKEKLADLMFKAMKAQDSRVHAIGRMKDDRRAEEKFNRLLNNGTYKKDGT